MMSLFNFYSIKIENMNVVGNTAAVNGSHIIKDEPKKIENKALPYDSRKIENNGKHDDLIQLMPAR